MKIVKDHSNIQEEKITFFKYKLQIFKDDLTNLIHAIDWAKTNTINSIILSESEVKIIEQILEREKIMFLNAEELLEFSQIKIASNGKNILYIINIPLISNEVCTTMLIKPIKKKNYINEIKFENIVKCENSIYAIRDSCESHNEKTICNKNKLVDLRNDTCTLLLLKSQPPNCRAINNQHVPNHEQLFVGTILLNDFNGSIKIDEEEIELHGTFLVQFENSTIRIEDDIYESKVMSFAEATPPLFQIMAKTNKIDEVLSLQMLKEINLNNTRKLETLKSSNDIRATINITLSGTLLIIMAIVGYLLKRKTPATTGQVTTPEAEKRENAQVFYIATEDVRIQGGKS
ncbi:uncharacterized protein LOC122757191 [Drosophila mojavensis]|uniref:uncharacterized protein LOC122757191 n=1 Tax=Drosophila mojavensis TaxID=7230 RepID=UPI001CD0BABB|nr:uncharacterized protein LOC122757191 [Drosophila mojavensis]XP_043864640.1 uncharacterized protein LOC122757191 [Drosophila mojavensis]